MRFLTCTSEGLLEERKQDRYDDACFNCLSENNQKYRNREDHHSHFPFPTRFPVVRGVCSLCEEGAGGGQEDGIDLGRSSPLSDDLMGVELITIHPNRERVVLRLVPQFSSESVHSPPQIGTFDYSKDAGPRRH